MADPRSEPSMEDILASIKRIIADEQSPPPTSPRLSPSQPAAPPVSQVMQPRTPSPATPARQPAPPWPSRREAVPEPPAPESILELTDRAPAPVAQPRVAGLPPVQRAVERIRQAEADLAQPAPKPVPRDLLPRTPAPRATGGDVTLEALAREMLEPMLADWIERNLPEMVERIVQTEIRRMTDRDS